jgi:putative flippase GtrA
MTRDASEDSLLQCHERQVKDRLRQFLTFGAVGVAATAIQYAVLIICVELLGLRPTLSSGIGFTLSAAANYQLNHRLTFRSSRPHRSAAMRFALVAAIALLLNVFVMDALTAHWHAPYLLAQIAATALVFLWTFGASAGWTFAHRSRN